MTGSSRCADARPVLRPANSRRNTSKAPSMRRFNSLMSAPDTVLPLVLDDREPALAGQDVGEGPLLVNREYQNRNPVFTRQRDGGRVHHLEVPREHFEVAEALVTLGVGLLARVGAVDSIDLGALEQDVAAHLRGAQRGCRVRGEERIAGAGGEDDNATLLHVPQG